MKLDEIVDGNKIVKLTEGMWNKSSKQGCLFSLELFKNVAIDVNGEIIVAYNELILPYLPNIEKEGKDFNGWQKQPNKLN